MIKIELTDEEATTIMIALDNYRASMERAWYSDGNPDDREAGGSAEWCWQKIYGALATDRNATAVEAVKASLKGELPERFNNSVADAVGEGEQPNNTTNASVDPFTLPTRSNYENMK